MKKQKDPAFLFYSRDWLTGTHFFSFEQKGKYIDLLCAQHDHGHLSEKQISIICHGEIDDEVMAKFEVDEEGKWFNVKLDEEIKRRKEYSLYQKELATKRWNKKKDAMAYAKDDAKDDAMAYAGLDAPRTETETETETEATISKLSKTHVGETLTQTLTDPLEDLYSDLF
jgi:hypothetical protein